MRQMEMGGRSLFAGAAAAALLWSLVFIGIGTAVARAATLPVDVGGWTPAAAGISKAPEAKNSSYGGTRVETTAHAAGNNESNDLVLQFRFFGIFFLNFLRENI